MAGRRQTIWIDDKMDELINSAPPNLSLNAKIKHIMCGDTPKSIGDTPGDTPKSIGDTPNINKRLTALEDMVEQLMIWKSDMDDY